MRHTDFDGVFEGGRFGDFDVRVRRVGDVNLASGSVTVRDTDGESWLDVRGIPDGTFPVEAAIATRDGHESFAALRIVFSSEPTRTWEVQSRDGERPHPPFEYPGVSIGSGWLAIKDTFGENEAEMVAIEVGTHDQTFSVYLGRGDDGRVTALAVDFNVLVEPLFDLVELALPFSVGRLDDSRFALVGVEAWATAPTELELRGDIARICFARAGDTSAKFFMPIMQTRPSLVQRFTFPIASGPAFVRIYVGCRPLTQQTGG